MVDLRALVLGDVADELANTRRLLERVPDAHFDWKPHEKSWHLGGLATHLSRLPTWHTMVLRSDELDLATLPSPPEPPDAMGPVLVQFDENAGELEAAMAGVEAEALAAPWTLRMGDHEIMSGPRAVVLRRLGVSHMAHHRGQLTVYLRLLDIPVPRTYGPTADEPGGFG